MISKNIRIGMKVVPISKSIGQNFDDWKAQYLKDNKYVRVVRLRTYQSDWYWICEIPNSNFVGHFKSKDLVEYQE